MTVSVVGTTPSGAKFNTILDPATDEHTLVVGLSQGGVPANVSTVQNGTIGAETSALLGAGGVYTSPAIDTLNYAQIDIAFHSDVISAVNGIQFMASNDGLDWNSTDEYSYVSAGPIKTYSLNMIGRYFMVSYTNGAIAQGHFYLWVMLKKSAGVQSSHRVGDTISAEEDALLSQSVLKARRPDGLFYNIDSSQNGNLQVGIGDIQSDAGARVRISQLTTLADYKILNADRTLLFENAGTGTGTFTGNKYNMAVAAGQWFIKQSRRYMHYFSGKSQVVEMTCDTFAPQPNVIKRFGYFSSNAVSPFDTTYDGFWLESDGATIRLRSSRAGVSTLNVPITSWSGYAYLAEYQTLTTWNNFTVVLIDFLWLGGAIMRLWVKTSLGFVLAHIFHYSGVTPDTFIKSPNQPLRCEIRSTGGAGAFRYVCAQIATEGSTTESGLSRAVDTGTTVIAANTVGTKYPIKAIRKATAQRDIAVQILDFSVLVETSNDVVLWTIEISPTLSAALTYSAVPNSAVEQATGNGVITVTGPGTIIASGYVVQNIQPSPGILIDNFLAYLGGTLANVMDEYILCATPCTANINLRANLGYKEY